MLHSVSAPVPLANIRGIDQGDLLAFDGLRAVIIYSSFTLFRCRLKQHACSSLLYDPATGEPIYVAVRMRPITLLHCIPGMRGVWRCRAGVHACALLYM